ncbi:MAG: hypothetical protein ACJAXJ_003023 [Colwellia sp.]|jgi:hypothetical protein
MISHPDKCVFVHIPKAAGQSVEKVFVQRAGLSWENRAPLLLRPNTDPTMGPPRLAHLTAAEYIEKGYINQAQFNEYFTFSFVRNPWSRLVSEYRYRQYPYTFKQFLLEKFPIPASDDYTQTLDLYRHVVPQSQFLFAQTGRQLVDFIGKFEQLDKDFAFVCQTLGMPLQKVPHVNQTLSPRLLGSIKRKIQGTYRPSDKKIQHYSELYDEESYDFVAKLYHQDIALFDYKFETHDEQK